MTGEGEGDETHTQRKGKYAHIVHVKHTKKQEKIKGNRENRAACLCL